MPASTKPCLRTIVSTPPRVLQPHVVKIVDLWMPRLDLAQPPLHLVAVFQASLDDGFLQSGQPPLGYNARGVHHLNKWAVVLVTHGSWLKGRGREFLARRPRSHTADRRKINGSSIEHQVVV
jgi:hypothetical protein